MEVNIDFRSLYLKLTQSFDIIAVFPDRINNFYDLEIAETREFYWRTDN